MRNEQDGRREGKEKRKRIVLEIAGHGKDTRRGERGRC